MFVTIFTSLGIENLSQHSGRPRTFLALIPLLKLFFILFCDPRVSTRCIASLYSWHIIYIPKVWIMAFFVDGYTRRKQTKIVQLWYKKWQAHIAYFAVGGRHITCCLSHASIGCSMQNGSTSKHVINIPDENEASSSAETSHSMSLGWLATTWLNSCNSVMDIRNSGDLLFYVQNSIYTYIYIYLTRTHIILCWVFRFLVG